MMRVNHSFSSTALSGSRAVSALSSLAAVKANLGRPSGRPLLLEHALEAPPASRIGGRWQ